MIKHFLNPPNWFTAASIFCGFYAILLASGNPGEPEVFYRAGLLICFAGIFDMLDGPLARITGRGSQFGRELDSLADLVSFGVAPAVLVYSWGLDALGPIGLIAAFSYTLCGAMRLARFNTRGEKDANSLGEGLAITMAGGLLAAMVMTHAALGRTFVANPTSPLILMVLMSVLMVSKVPYRLFSSMRRSLVTVAAAALFLAVGIILGIRFDIALWFFGSAIVYAFSGPMEQLARVMVGRRRVAGHGFTLDLDDDSEI
jgi:CDP-diacylglycerol--serine O-phosphatidyltransferase